MSTITWKYVKLLRNADSISNFEKEKGVIFPSDLKDILSNYNGGRPSLRYYDLENEADKEFKTLLSFNKEDIENIYKYYPLDSSDKTIIPFASDPAGNFFVLKDRKIALWNHEDDSIKIICNTITEFLQMLHD